MTEPTSIGKQRPGDVSMVLNSIPIGVFSLDRQGEITYCNSRCLKMLGLETSEELMGRTVSSLIRNPTRKQSGCSCEDCRITKALHDNESIHVADDVFWRNNGKRVAVEYWCNPISTDGNVTGAVVCFVDVSVRREEDSYRDQLARLVESSHDAILSKDLQGIITSWNQGASNIYGFQLEEAIGQHISMIFPDGQSAEELEITEAIQGGNELNQFEVLRRRKDGSIRNISLTVSPIFGPDEQVVGSCSIERDVTQHRKSQDDIIRAKNAAEHAESLALAANRSRAEFLANISHELRTPMNAILGMLQLSLEENQLDPTISDYLTTAQSSADSLLELVNEILDFSKIESGKFEIVTGAFDVRETVDAAAKALSPKASEKGLEMFCEVDPNVPRSLIGDAKRIQQVVTNLLNNAVKFTERGEIVIEVAQKRQLPNEVRLRFSVADTGIGIAKSDHERVFSPFAQADMSSTRQHHGTGLGLAICRELVSLMGGNLQLESEVDKGSEFSFELSLPIEDASRPADLIPKSLSNDLSVLIVDDNPTNLRILEKILVSWSVQPVVAENARQALNILDETIGTDHEVAMAIVDGLMPGVDGFELAEQMAEKHGKGKTPVVIMQAAADLALFSDKKASAPVANYLTKPVSQSELLNTVVDTLDLYSRLPHRRQAENAPPLPVRPLGILLVEDLPANQKVATAILEKRGHQVVAVPNGRVAIDSVQDESQKFDVVLMDIQMPVMDGFQATAAIRELADPDIAQLPIVAMTAHAMPGDREACLSAGMDAYIAKPLDAKNLVEVVEAIAQQPDSPAVRFRKKLVSDNKNKISSQPEKPRLQLVDLDAALTRLGGDRDLFKEFVAIYKADAPSLWQRIIHSVKQNNSKELSKAAHALKGLISNFGAKECVEVAQQVETAGREQDIQTAKSLLNRFQGLYDRLWHELDGFSDE